MSNFALISIPYHPRMPDENEYTKVQNKRTVWVSLACGGMLLILVTIGVMIGVILTKKTITRNVLSTTTPNDQILPFMKVNITTHNSSTCSLPLYPFYNKNGTTVVDVADTSGNDVFHLVMPACIYLNSEGDLYIGGGMGGRIVKYSANNTREGMTVATLDIGRLTRSLYINHRNNDLYFVDVATGGSYRVQYLPSNATSFQAALLLIGTSFDCFGMDLDDQLNIYVSEYNNHRVVKWLAPMYKEYVVVAGNGTPGSEMNQLSFPHGIYLDPSNNDLYIVDSRRIQLWPAGSTIGQTVLKIGLLYAAKIKRDCHGNFYILDYRSVKLFSASMEVTGLEGEILVGLPTGDPFVQQSSKVDYFKYAADLYLDMQNDDLYVVDSGRAQVRKYTVNGELVSGRK